MFNIKKEVNLLKDEIISMRRELHKIPELGLEEFKTAAFIKSILDDLKVFYEIVGETGIIAIIDGENNIESKKTIAIRSDMDGLPITEKNDIPYKSAHIGKMHACGHDCHMAIVLGVIKILNANKIIFGGRIKFIFEPAEETFGGAKMFIENGYLDDVDTIIGLHVDEDVDYGKVLIKSGSVNAASNPFDLEIIGCGSHAAYPHRSIDSINIAANVIVNTQSIISREVDASSQAIISFSTINSGVAKNVISENAKMSGIIRTINNEDRRFIVQRFKDIVEGTTKAMRGKVFIDIEEGYPSLINDYETTNFVVDNISSVIGKENIIYQKSAKMGTESFAYFSQVVKSVFYFLGTRNSNIASSINSAHTSLFNIDEEALILGVILQIKIILAYLTK